MRYNIEINMIFGFGVYIMAFGSVEAYRKHRALSIYKLRLDEVTTGATKPGPLQLHIPEAAGKPATLRLR
jgi:hypothetical protein